MKIEFLLLNNNSQQNFSDCKLDESVIFNQIKTSDSIIILSYEIVKNNIDSARKLSKIKNNFKEQILKNECYLLTDETSEYYNKNLYPLFNTFERKLRQIIYFVASYNEQFKNIANEIEKKNFNEIYNSCFVCNDFWKNVQNVIKSSKMMTKENLIKKINEIKEVILWNKITNKTFILDNFEGIQKFRNDVMHAHNISYEEYDLAKKTIKEAIKELDAIKEQIPNMPLEQLTKSFNILSDEIQKNDDSLFEGLSKDDFMQLVEIYAKKNSENFSNYIDTIKKFIIKKRDD